MTQWRVERLGRRGDGVAIAEGDATQQALAALTLPGEHIEGEALPAPGGRHRILRPRILTPSPDRVTAPCRHYRSCGGCSLMHGRDEFVADWKKSIVEQALAAQGIQARVGGIATSPPRSRRRAVLSARRLKSGPVVGFHARASDQIVAIEDCHILRPAIMAAMPALRELTRIGTTRRQELAITVIETETGLDVTVTGGRDADQALMQDLAALARQADWARLSWNGDSLTRRAPVLTMGPARVTPPPAAFLQATAEGEAALREAVLQGVGTAGRIADLYCGIGTFALPLAAGAEVHAVEGLASPLSALDQAWRNTPNLRRITTEKRDLARNPLMADELAGFGAVVLDPPRAGAGPQVAELTRSGVPVVVSVSCDPVSFARDIKALTDGGYRLDQLSVVDQFRWSPHVEIVGILNNC